MPGLAQLFVLQLAFPRWLVAPQQRVCLQQPLRPQQVRPRWQQVCPQRQVPALLLVLRTDHPHQPHLVYMRIRFVSKEKPQKIHC